jgi:hypothetical protein
MKSTAFSASSVISVPSPDAFPVDLRLVILRPKTQSYAMTSPMISLRSKRLALPTPAKKPITRNAKLQTRNLYFLRLATCGC